jgi:signal transduction histidine kinase
MAVMTSQPARAGVVAGHHAARAVKSAPKADPRWTGVVVVVLCATSILLSVAFLPADLHAPPALYATTGALLAVLALAVSWLLRRRFLRTRRRSDLLLAVGALAFSLIHIITTAAPAALGAHPHGALMRTDVYGEVLVDALFAAAALASRVPHLVVARHPDRLLGSLSVGTVGLAALAGVIFSPLVVGESTAIAVASGHPFAIAVAAVACGLLFLGATVLTREATVRHDGAQLLVAMGLVVMAGAPPLQLRHGTDDNFSLVGDVLQMIGFGLIGVAALRWEVQARQLAERAAALAERQRVARDLHDGLAQDLAFIAAHSAQITSEAGGEHPVVTAARRALDVSRSTIAELTDPTAATTHEVLEVMATELRKRFGITITLDVDLRHEPSAELREHATRIAREATANAARHGEAHTVVISLREVEDRVNLRVEDDGRGVDVVTSGRRDEGFGLRSIRERAAAAGGSAELRQLEASGGSVLDVVLT